MSYDPATGSFMDYLVANPVLLFGIIITALLVTLILVMARGKDQAEPPSAPTERINGLHPDYDEDGRPR